MNTSRRTNFRMEPSARDSSTICGTIPEDTPVEVYSFVTSELSDLTWALVAVDDTILENTNNPECENLEYVFIAKKLLQ